MKKWVGTNNYWFYVLGMLIYIVGLNFLAQSFKYKNIAVASVIFVLFNIITLSVFSWIYFKESLSVLQIVGIVIGLVSVIVLEVA
jgi:multidrug transporter EmrE-like cation transporter